MTRLRLPNHIDSHAPGLDADQIPILHRLWRSRGRPKPRFVERWIRFVLERDHRAESRHPSLLHSHCLDRAGFGLSDPRSEVGCLTDNALVQTPLNLGPIAGSMVLPCALV